MASGACHVNLLKMKKYLQMFPRPSTTSLTTKEIKETLLKANQNSINPQFIQFNLNRHTNKFNCRVIKGNLRSTRQKANFLM